MHLLGIGFHDTPSPRRPIRVVHAALEVSGARLEGFEDCERGEAFDALLARPGPWLGAFDFPFGFARELVVARGWPQQWDDLVGHLERLSRGELGAELREFCASHPRRNRFAGRATERALGVPPAMGRIGTPHALRLRVGASRLRSADVTIPGVRAGDPQRVAIEANPARVAVSVTRGVWRSGLRRGRGDVRELERERLVDALERGLTDLGVSIQVPRAERAAIVADDRGDRLAALICVAQAAWAARRPRFGLPTGIDSLEGWIAFPEVALAAGAS